MVLSYQIIDSVLASIYWKDINGIYLGCNQYMVKMAGFENREQIIGKTDFDMSWKEAAQEIRKIDQLVIQNNKTYKNSDNIEVDINVSKSKVAIKASSGYI